MKKRIISLLLSIVLCLSLCLPAFAASSEKRVNGTISDDGTSMSFDIEDETAHGKYYGCFLVLKGQYKMCTVELNKGKGTITVPGSLGGKVGNGEEFVVNIPGVAIIRGTKSETPGKVTVTFDYGYIDAPTAETKEINKGSAVTKPEDPTRFGYTFVGWFEKDAETPYDFAQAVNDSLTLYAHWTQVPPTPQQYTITFNANGGTIGGVLTTQMKTGDDGKLGDLPADPTREGYTFDGWFDAIEGGTQITAETEFTADDTVYAHWTQATATRYTITFNANGGTSSAATMQTGTDGKLTGALPTATRTGYTFNGWYTAATGGTEITASTVFSENTTVYAHWTSNGTGGSTGGGGGGGGSSSSSSNVTVRATKNGSVSYSPSRPSKGSTVTLTVRPNSGYQLDSIKVLDSKGAEVELTKTADDKYTFVMPSGRVTVESQFVKSDDSSTDTPTTPQFTDVSASSYYYDAVQWAVENGVTTGVNATTFNPNGTCTRAQMVTFLWRAAGSPSVEGTSPFTDVTAGSYYYQAVLWAVQQGITTGTTATTFNPNGLLTRAHTVTFLYRYAGSPAVSTVSSFSDVAAGQYYTNAVSWAVAEGITNGYENNQFRPANNCTRAQTVTFLYRMLNK